VEFFSIICDECTDIANQEQLSLSVRYVAREKVCESFVGYFELDEGVTGEAIANIIEKAIADCNLDPFKIRGQAYDGASNMSGQHRGCAAILQRKYPQAVYSHCYSHVLNLAIVNCCSCIQVQNLFAVMSKVHKFFDNHPKCQYMLNTFCEGSETKLKSLCKTRWLQRIDAFHIFMDIFDSIIKSFDQVASNPSSWSRDSTVDAVSLSKAMLNFDFIITLHTVERYMSYTESLTRSLQARALDLLQAVKHISVLKQVLTDARADVDRQFNSLFLNASKCAQQYDITVKPPRRCQRQTACENHPADTTEEYYCRSLAIPFLDHLKEEIERRFTSHSVMAIRCLGIIPSCFSSSEKADDNEMLDFF